MQVELALQPLALQASMLRAPAAGYWKGWSPPTPSGCQQLSVVQNLEQGFGDFSSPFPWAVCSATARYCLKILNQNDMMAKEITC